MTPQNISPLSRRSFLRCGSFATAATLIGRKHAGLLFAQQATDGISQMRAMGATAKITVQPARRNISVLLGSGGNIAVLTGKDGKLLVDSGLATSKPQITEALNGLSSEPLKQLIDTHWHFDHTDGNEWMHAAGATITAHENTRKRLSTPQVIAAYNAKFPPSPAGAIPSKVFSGEDTLHTNNETLHLSHYAPAHTDTDISVHFAEANVFHAGDTWFNGTYPFIDYSSGGNIDGMIAAAVATLSRIDAKTIVIPGHGPVGDKAHVVEYHDMLSDVRQQVAALKKQGKTIEETVAAKPTAKYDAKWGTGFLTPDTFIKLVCAGV